MADPTPAPAHCYHSTFHEYIGPGYMTRDEKCCFCGDTITVEYRESKMPIVGHGSHVTERSWVREEPTSTPCEKRKIT